jgi:hypothetical protein
MNSPENFYRKKVALPVTQSGKDGSGAHDEQTAQVGITGFGDPAQSGFAAAAVLAGDESGLGGELATILEIMTAAQAGNQINAAHPDLALPKVTEVCRQRLRSSAATNSSPARPVTWLSALFAFGGGASAEAFIGFR